MNLNGRPLDCNFPKIRFCRRGHAIVGANAMVRRKGVDCRTCAKMKSREFVRSGRITEPLARMVIEEIQDGKTMAQITGRRGCRYVGGGIIQAERLKAFCNANAKLGKLIRETSARNAAAQCGPLVTAPSIIRLSSTIMDDIQAAVPRHLSADHRDDVVQNIWIAVIARKISRQDIAARAHDFVRAEYRSSHNAWGPRSLDGRLFSDGATTLGDTITRGLWD
jgi:hypothetical protein